MKKQFEFNVRITKKKNQRKNSENHEIPKISCQNHENHENLINQRQNNENHNLFRIPRQNYKIIKI